MTRPAPSLMNEAGRKEGELLSARAACSPLDIPVERRCQRVKGMGAYCAGPRRASQAPRALRRPGEAVTLLEFAIRSTS